MAPGATLNVAADEGLLINDIESEGQQQLLIVAGYTPAKDASGQTIGSLTVNPDGSFVYAPPDDWWGMVSFTYKVGDGVNVNPEDVAVTIGVNDLHVFHNGADVTQAPGETVVGEKASLSLQLVGPGFTKPVEMRNPQWTIPGMKIENYEVSFELGIVTPFDAAELATLNPSFYWIDGTTAAVSASVTVRIGTPEDFDDFAGTAEGEIVVQEPTPQAISYTYGPITHPQGAEPDGVATLQLGGGGVRGITVNGNATAPADYNGSLGFIQLVQSVRSYRDPNNNLYRFDTADHTASGYAYDNTPEAATVIYGDNAVSLPAGETSPEPTQILDSPFEHRNATYEYVGAHDDFSAFLMFKPLAADAIWVTIRKFKWGWEADASNAGTQGNPNWQAGVGEKTEPALQGPSTQLPEWDARVQDLATPNNYELVT